MMPLAAPLTDVLSYRLVLTADVMTIRVPRRLAEITLENWNLERLSTAVATVVSELVTNSWKESPGAEIEVGLSLGGGWLRLEVRDSSDTIPEVPTELDPDAEGGRGLWMASHMSDKFGIDPHPSADGGGKTIWTMWLCGPPGAAPIGPDGTAPAAQGERYARPRGCTG